MPQRVITAHTNRLADFTKRLETGALRSKRCVHRTCLLRNRSNRITNVVENLEAYVILLRPAHASVLLVDLVPYVF